MPRSLSLIEKRQLLEQFKRSRGSKKIRDLEDIAQAFGCSWKVTSAGENQIFYSPYRKINPVVVAIPHSNDDVLKKYTSRFVHMLEDTLSHEIEIEGGDLYE